jgi:hypothetical protein
MSRHRRLLRFDTTGVRGCSNRAANLRYLGGEEYTHTDLQRKRVRRYRDRARRFRASAAKTKKRTDRPAFIQLAQLCDILADGIEAQLRADVVHSSN